MTVLVPTGVRVPMVRPARAIVVRGIADLRAAPGGDAELVDQALYGERMTVLGGRDGWAYVQGADHYFGWIRDAHLAATDADRRTLVAVPLAPVRDAPGPSAETVDRLPRGLAPGPRRSADGRLAAAVGRGRRAGVDRGRGHRGGGRPAGAPAVRGRPPRDGEDLPGRAVPLGRDDPRGDRLFGARTAGVPSQWVALDRDADQQSLEGRPVDLPMPGDLLFFGTERVTHAGLAAGGREFLHAPMRGGAVEVASLDAAREPRAIRRYLAD